MATLDERYREKLRARAENRAPVIVSAPSLPKGDGPEAIDARYKAKLAHHGKPLEPKPEAPKAAKGKGNGGETKADPPPPAPPLEPKPEAPKA